MIILRFFGNNFQTKNARNSIKPSKHFLYSLVSYTNSSKKMVLGVGVQCIMMSFKCKQIYKDLLASFHYQHKTRHTKLNIFYSKLQDIPHL